MTSFIESFAQSNFIHHVRDELKKIGDYSILQDYVATAQVIPVVGLAASCLLSIIGTAEIVSGLALGLLFGAFNFITAGTFDAYLQPATEFSFKTAEIGLRSLALSAANLATLGIGGVACLVRVLLNPLS